MNNHLLNCLQHTVYHKILKQHLYKKEAGLADEQYVAVCLQNTDVIVLHDIMLGDEQIDFIVLHAGFALICEVKNWKDALTFESDPPQVIQDGQHIFTSLELQLPNKIRALRNFVYSVPIYEGIIFASNKNAHGNAHTVDIQTPMQI